MINQYTRGNNRLSRLFFRICHGIYWRMTRIPPLKQIKRYFGLKRSDRLYGETIPAWYRSEAGKPVDDQKVLFVENRAVSLSDSFRLIYEDVKQAGYTVHVHYLHEFDPGTDSMKPLEAYAKDAATAKYIFLNDAALATSSFPLRKETKVIQLWHGCGAFKKWGASTANKKFGASQKEREKHFLNYYKNLSLVTVSSPDVAWAYIEAMGLEDQKEIVRPTGVSRTDVYFDPEFIQKNTEKVHTVFPASIGKKILLFAPTFRGRVAGASTPDFQTFDLRRLKKEFGDEYVVVIKNHPYVGPVATPKIPADLDGTFAMDLTHTCTIETLLCAADLCITDYSSLVFEYSLLDRPVLFYAYDLDDYNDWRGFYYNYSELAPGPVCKTMDELTDAIRQSETAFDREKLAAFRKKFMSACDGHSTERIEQLVFGRSLRCKPEES